MIKENTCNKKVKDFHCQSQYIPLYTEWPSSNYIIISVCTELTMLKIPLSYFLQIPRRASGNFLLLCYKSRSIALLYK